MVAYHHHATELHHLREDERNGFMANVVQVAALVEAVTGCNKINSAIYGDIVSHLHFHIVPKYDNQSEWGRPFIANPEKPTILPPDEFRQLCTLYSAKLSSDST